MTQRRPSDHLNVRTKVIGTGTGHSSEAILDMIDEVLLKMVPTQEEIAYETGKIVGWFPISKTRRLVRLAYRLEKP